MGIFQKVKVPEYWGVKMPTHLSQLIHRLTILMIIIAIGQGW